MICVCFYYKLYCILEETHFTHLFDGHCLTINIMYKEWKKRLNRYVNSNNEK